jgi:uncharacterized protein with GYD domain
VATKEQCTALFKKSGFKKIRSEQEHLAEVGELQSDEGIRLDMSILFTMGQVS